MYAWANDALMEILVEKLHMREGFLAVKHFFFGDCGDLIVHFLDLAKDELKKSNWFCFFGFIVGIFGGFWSIFCYF